MTMHYSAADIAMAGTIHREELVARLQAAGAHAADVAALDRVERLVATADAATEEGMVMMTITAADWIMLVEHLPPAPAAEGRDRGAYSPR